MSDNSNNKPEQCSECKYEMITDVCGKIWLRPPAGTTCGFFEPKELPLLKAA